MKRILALVLMLTMLACLVSAFTVETSALGDVVMLYETKGEITIDGKLDGEYNLISKSTDKGDENWVLNPDLQIDGKTELYGCWDKENLYFFIKVPCNEEHSSWMDNASEHFIFNGHHCMWAILPDNPYLDQYYGNLDDGAWDWSSIYNAGFMYEFTTICDSRTGETVTTDHFKDLTANASKGFECVCLADGKYDTYEVKIPMKSLVTSYSPEGIVAEDGTLFGIGFRLGLLDHGTGYGDRDPESANYKYEYTQDVQYSDYFKGAKWPRGLTYMKLVEDKPEPKKIRKKYEVFPSASGLWVYNDAQGEHCDIKVSSGIATISGSTSSWPSAKAVYEAPLLVKKSAALVYDFTVEGGQFSLRFNDEDMLGNFITDQIDPGSGDILPGTYQGYISFEDLIKEYGANDDGYYQIDNTVVYSVSGAKITVNKLNIEPDYVAPAESSEEPVESSEEPVESSEEPVESSEEPVESSEEVPAESSEEAPAESKAEESEEAPAESKAEESKEAPAEKSGFPVWAWIAIGVGAAAIIAVVVILILKKKK